MVNSAATETYLLKCLVLQDKDFLYCKGIHVFYFIASDGPKFHKHIDKIYTCSPRQPTAAQDSPEQPKAAQSINYKGKRTMRQ